MKKRAPVWVLISALVISPLILPVTPIFKTPAAAQGQGTPQFTRTVINAPTLRTIDDMFVDEATSPFPGLPGGEVVFRPGMDPAQYAAAKAAAAKAAPTVQRPAVPTAPRGPLPAGPLFGCEGIDEFSAVNESSANSWPPDADGAAGDILFGQTTNVHVTFWNKTSCLLEWDWPLNTFMGYLPPTYPAAKQLFDARIVHDNTFHRWVVTAEGRPESATVQYQFIAVSTDEDPGAPWLVYVFNTRSITGSGCFWDFPQLGMSDTSILMTANIFDCAAASGRWISMNKQWMYQGIGFPFCFASGGVVELKNWAPPKVLDLSNSVWFARAAPSGSVLNLAQILAPDAICPQFGFVGTVGVPAYSVPPNATQPGTAFTLDTSDSRFSNRSSQLGGELWNVHSVAFGAAVGRIYRIVLGPPPVSPATACTFFTGLTSADFNPSIAVNSAKNIAVGFSSTNAPAGVNAQVRLGTHVGAGCTITNNYLIFASSVPLTGNPCTPDPVFCPPGSPIRRWGDYSSTSIDPVGFVWGVNERIDNSSDPTGDSWGTHFFKATIP